MGFKELAVGNTHKIMERVAFNEMLAYTSSLDFEGRKADHRGLAGGEGFLEELQSVRGLEIAGRMLQARHEESVA